MRSQSLDRVVVNFDCSACGPPLNVSRMIDKNEIPSLHLLDGVVELPMVLGREINWDFVSAHPYHGEHGIGAGARPAFGLAHETLPDRYVETLA